MSVNFRDVNTKTYIFKGKLGKIKLLVMRCLCSSFLFHRVSGTVQTELRAQTPDGSIFVIIVLS